MIRLCLLILILSTGAAAQVSVGTFNLAWAFDEREDRSPLADEQNADTSADWDWKRSEIAKILVEQDLDIVALQEIGGRREIEDLRDAIETTGGPDYFWAYRKGTDTTTDQQVALLSRYPLHSWRRFDVRVSKHLAVEAKLPGVGDVTFIVAHLKAGGSGGDLAQRRFQARALKTETAAIVGSRPVVILGDFNTRGEPGTSGYKDTAPGILAGADTSAAHDDCRDSGAQPTHTSGWPFDRIVACDIELSGVDVVAEDKITRNQRDPYDPNDNWSSRPVDAWPFRDVSDHYVLRANLDTPAAAADSLRTRLLDRINALELELSALRDLINQLVTQ